MSNVGQLQIRQGTELSKRDEPETVRRDQASASEDGAVERKRHIEQVVAEAKAHKAVDVRARYDTSLDRSFIEYVDVGSEAVVFQAPPESVVRYSKALLDNLITKSQRIDKNA